MLRNTLSKISEAVASGVFLAGLLGFFLFLSLGIALIPGAISLGLILGSFWVIRAIPRFI